jgi:uncharacterized Fe-S cluster protein YjdI
MRQKPAEGFQPQQKAMGKYERATSEDIMKAIDKCPSGALSYKKAGESQEHQGQTQD